MIYEKLTEQECYLVAILKDVSGIDLAEFSMTHAENKETYGIFRAWPFQYAWFRNKAKRHIDAAARLVGKALDVDTPILTSVGWSTMGELEDGDYVYAPDGKLVEILTAFEIMEDRPCYEVNFGSETIVADMDHLWAVAVEGSEDFRVITTLEIKGLLMGGVAVETVPNHKGERFTFVEIKQVESRPVRCIEVDHPESLYLVGKQFIPTHNTMSISLRALAFPFNYPDQEMMVTAPEATHTSRVTDDIELAYNKVKLASAMVNGKFKHKPFKVMFINGAQIYARIPQRDGSGVQGAHPTILEQDEGAKYPERGWSEIKETLKANLDNAQWRCIAEDQLVLTKDGLKNISSVEIGDLVWTHKNRWRPVINVFDNGIADCVLATGQGTHGIVCTPNHKFLTRDKVRRGKIYSEPEWTEFKNILNTDKNKTTWASPASVTNKMSVPPIKAIHSWPQTLPDVEDLDWLWLYGLFIAEGYTSFWSDGKQNHSRAYWCVNDSECDLVKEKLSKFGLNSYFYKQGDHSVKVCISNAAVANWLREQAGHLAHNKSLAPWVFGLNEESRQAIFDGMVFGDGSYLESRKRIDYATASEKLAVGIKLLAQSLGYVSNIRTYPPKDHQFGDRIIHQKQHFCVQMTRVSDFKNAQSDFLDDGLVWSPTGKSIPVGERHVYDLEVEEDHSYVVNGIIVSNCHGVSFGVGGTFNELIAGRNPNWEVTYLPAMITPIWNEKMKQERIEEYFGYNTSDYRRNILGLQADAGSPIFVLQRLMACVDHDLSSDYNLDEYYYKNIDEGGIRDVQERWGGSVLDLIDIPPSHREYKNVWIGMDFGWTQSPSAILVFGEVPNKQTGTVLKLIARILLHKVSAPDQLLVMKHLIDYYRPVAFACDATGAGHPVYQILQSEAESDPELKFMRDRIKDCQFASKVIVGFDDRIEVDENKPDGFLDAAIKRPFIEASTDTLRSLVDKGRMLLPFDKELIGELESAEMSNNNIGQTIDAYGRSGRKQGLHNLDAMRMALFTYETHYIDYMIKDKEQTWEPPPIMFF